MHRVHLSTPEKTHRDVTIFDQDNDTIAAIATPTGTGGIGIVKVSGPAVLEIRNRLFRPSKGNTQEISHRLVHGMIVDENGVIDEVLVSWMAGPYSYTGEDVLEINAHGGIAVLQRILGLVIQSGARMAEPGEFTKRGFLNGRIDITKAEAVVDIINARSEQAARMASRLMMGELRGRVEEILGALMSILAHVDGRIDFPEEVGEADGPDVNHAAQLRQNVLNPIIRLIEHCFIRKWLTDGARIVIIGKPNVGKSSLMNRLLDNDRMIVSENPGTTRDAVEDVTRIDGLPIVLVDTAGIRNTQDPVESMGIGKSLSLISSADLVLLVVEAGKAWCADDDGVWEKVAGQPVILVKNKTDLTDEHHLPETKIDKPVRYAVSLSAKLGWGVEELRKKIVSVLAEGEIGAAMEGLMPNERQTAQLSAAAEAIGVAIDIMENRDDDSLAAIEMDSAIVHLNAVLGHGGAVDILEEIFSRFCVGK